MMFKPIWYDQDQVIKEDDPIEASDEEDARKKAFTNYNGKAPAPMLTLLPV